MKKTLQLTATAMFLLFLLSTNTAVAHYDKGSIIIETNFGNLSFNKNNSKNESSGTITKNDGNTLNFYLYPRLGYFVADNFVVGAEMYIYFYSSKSNYFNNAGVKTSDYKSSSTQLGLSPFARYYFGGSKDGKSKFYGQISAGVSFYLSNKNDSKNYNASGTVSSTYNTNYTKKYNTFNGSALLGWNKMLTDNVALNLNLGYMYSRSTQSSTSTYTLVTPPGPATTYPETKSTYNNSGVNWNLGFTMFIPSKKGKK
jgi:outer membrane protein